MGVGRKIVWFAKEIIASEIGLYGDDPEWVGYYSSLSKAYGNHPIAWEIAGDHSLLLKNHRHGFPEEMASNLLSSLQYGLFCCG